MKSIDEYEQLKLKNQICFPLYAASRAVIQQYTSYLKPLGITYTQYLVLLVLWENDCQKVTDLCQQLYLDSGTVTPLLKKMEQGGLLTRTRSREDERVVVVQLCEKGRELREQAKNIPFEIAGSIHIKQEDARQLYELLYRILNQSEKA